MPVQVDILLATYNGAVFLPAQLDSVIQQTYRYWHLYIRDDGSSDETVSIIERYTGQYPDKITYLGSAPNGRGAKGNFSLLMEVSTAPYIVFCDQDDIWLPDKVAVKLATLQELENGQPQVPAMIFTDLSMIDANGAMLAASLWKHDHLNPRHTSLSRLLVQNVPYGCASMINRSLLHLATPVDDRALLHDHWMALLSAACGKIGYLAKPTILHRIHDRNTSRAGNPLHKQRNNDLRAIAGGRNFNNYFGLLQGQAQAVEERLLENTDRISLDSKVLRVIQDFVHLRDKSLLSRKKLMLQNRYFKQSWLQTLKWIFRV